MQVRDAMTRNVRTVRPDTSLQDAAELMLEMDVGALPVADGDRLVGMITDRDIATRGVAAGKRPDSTVDEAMSNEVLYVFEEEDVDDVCENMAEQQVRRMPVVNRDKRLVGIVSLSDLAKAPDCLNTSAALEGITRPGGVHNRSSDSAAE